MSPLKKRVYGEPLNLKEQVELAEDLLDNYITMLNDTFPDINLWMSGSILYNSLSVGCNEGVKLELLSRAKIKDSIEKCSGCGRDHEAFVKKWILERYIGSGKKRLKEVKE